MWGGGGMKLNWFWIIMTCIMILNSRLKNTKSESGVFGVYTMDFKQLNFAEKWKVL